MDDVVEILAKRAGVEWPGISACKGAAEKERAELAAVLDSEGLVPADTTFVAFGSLARAEATIGSDLDWTLLVDGPADPQHVRLRQEIDKRLVELGKKEPGASGLFGGLAFSHELIHAIGGEADTNSNTTRRILLLLESCAIGPNAGVRERVVRHLFRRYVGEDSGYHRARNWQVRVPRFLLNDIVRFWRTMAVDYAAKRRDRAGKGWALRNLKLRLSRKLIFVSGLAMCLRCQLKPSSALTETEFEDEEQFNQVLEEFLIESSNRTPQEVVASLCLDFDATDAGQEIFDSYQRFLEILNDEAKRERLDAMGVEEATKDSLFEEAREIGTAFQGGLTKLFFHSDDELAKATQRYGVF